MNDERQSWFELCFEIEARHADAFSVLLAEAGHEGCELREGGGERSQVVIHIKADGIVAAQARATNLARVLPETAGNVEVTVREVDGRLWADNWRGYFPRLRIGARLEILPPWEPPSPTRSGMTTIVINPAMAFGTGHHETTAGCLEMIERFVRPGFRVADVGCGSGILSIAAAKLGAESVLAIDNDPEAVNAARANAVDNRVAERVTVALADGPATLGAEGARFDLLVANIYAETLVEMADALTSRVKRGGIIVLSGIEASRASLVEEAYAHRGWHERARLERGEWLTMAVTALNDSSKLAGGSHDRS